MRFWAGSIISALLTGCQALPPPEAASSPDGFAFEVKSWGALVHGWAIAADGSGTSVTRVSPSGSPWPPYTLEHRRFALTSRQLADLRTLAGEIPRPVPTDDKCESRMTDAAYGTLSLVEGGETNALAFYGGCFDAYYAPFLDKVKAIDALVMAASEKAPVGRREEVASETD
jgi:hypothetical protein